MVGTKNSKTAVLENLKLKDRWQLWIYLIPVILTFYTFEHVWFNDFNIYWHAGQKINSGQNIYQEPLLYGWRYLYPPFVAFFLSCFSFLPLVLASKLFLILSMLALLRMLFILSQIAKWYDIKQFKSFIWIIPTAIVAVYYGKINIHANQVTFIIVWASIESIWQCLRGNKFLAGLVLGLGITIKLIPIVFVFYFFYKKEYKLILAVLFSLVFFNLIPAIKLGWDGNLVLLGDWLQLINPIKTDHLALNEVNNANYWQGIDSLLSVFFAYTNKGFGFFLSVILRLLIAALLYFAIQRQKWMDKHSTMIYESVFICVAIPLVFPHMRDYEYYFLVPAIVFVSLNILTISNSKSRIFLFSVLTIHSVIMVIGSDLVGRKLFDQLLELRIHTIATIFYLGWMVWLIKPADVRLNKF